MNILFENITEKKKKEKKEKVKKESTKKSLDLCAQNFTVGLNVLDRDEKRVNEHVNVSTGWPLTPIIHYFHIKTFIWFQILFEDVIGEPDPTHGKALNIN